MSKKKIKIYEFMHDNDVSIEEITLPELTNLNKSGVGIISLMDQIWEHLRPTIKGEY